MNVESLDATRAMRLQYEIEQFLYHEAALLDERRFTEWLDLLDPELEYWMPVRSTRALGDEAHEFAQLGEGAFFDDDKASMEQRVRKLATGFAWAEDPPSRTRHNVSNVRILELRDSLVEIECNFLIYRTRLANDNDLWSGRRKDVLRASGPRFTIVKRHLFIDHVSLTSKNLSSFF